MHLKPIKEFLPSYVVRYSLFTVFACCDDTETERCGVLSFFIDFVDCVREILEGGSDLKEK